MTQDQEYTEPEALLANALGRVALIAALAWLVGLILARLGPVNLWVVPPFGPSAITSVGIVALLAWMGAADVRRHRELIVILIGGIALAAFAFLVLAFSKNNHGEGILLGLCAVAIAVVAVWLGRLVQLAPPQAFWTPWVSESPLLRAGEQVGRVAAIAFCAVSSLAALVNLAVAAVGMADAGALTTHPVLAIGSVVQLAFLSAFMFYAARDVRRYSEMFTLFVLSNIASLIGVIVSWLGIHEFGAHIIPVVAMTLSTDTITLGAAVLVSVIIAGGIVVKVLLNKPLHDHLSFFDAVQFRALEAVTQALISSSGDEKAEPYKVVWRTDGYLSSFRSGRLWLARLATLALEFAPLTAFLPPINYLYPALRKRFIDANFKRDIVEPRGIYWLLRAMETSQQFPFLNGIGRRTVDLVEGAMRFNMQLVYMGYYSDPATQESIHFTPFSRREKNFPVKPIRRYAPLQVTTPADLRNSTSGVIRNADVVIIGSGPAGATLAEQLAKQGREVLLLEKGPYVSPDDFSEDEVDMIGKLYSDGALQLVQSLRFSVLQGSTVGGTSVVNSAVCFETPQTVLDQWNNPADWNAGIDKAAFFGAQREVMQRMKIRRIDESLVTRAGDLDNVLNPGDTIIEQGLQKLRQARPAGQPDPYEYGVVKANITDCLGCGYCTIGCKYGRKLSMLDEVLPCAQQAHGPEKFRIFSEANVTRLVSSATGTMGKKITEIVVEIGGKYELVIQNPKTVIVSAGAIASSWLLMQSGIGRNELPVGRGLSFNLASPLYGVFPDKLDSYAGLQISHYLKVKDHPGFVMETWYNPPVSQALLMSGWLDTHFKNMARYDHMAAAGILVGTKRNAHLRRSLWFKGAPDIVYTPAPEDLATLADALVEFGRVLFSAGATEVFASTRRYHAYSPQTFTGKGIALDEDDLMQFHSLIKDERDILLGTGHPQGGNAISKNRGKLLPRMSFTGGVIDPDFKVWGYDNLFVCDASVFPGSITVNPQLTIMTMAQYAAARINQFR